MLGFVCDSCRSSLVKHKIKKDEPIHIAKNNQQLQNDGWGETHKTALHDSEDELEELNQFDELQQHSNERVISALEAVQKQFIL